MIYLQIDFPDAPLLKYQIITLVALINPLSVDAPTPALLHHRSEC